MRKKLLLLNLWLISTIISFSQHKSSLSLSAGPAFPIGSFGNKEIKSSSSGFAKTGPALNISFVHLLNKNWGLSITAYGQRHAYDTKALSAAFANEKFYDQFVFGGTFPLPIPNPGYSQYPDWKFSKDEWWIAAVMAGGYAEFPSSISPAMKFMAKVQVGALYAQSPETKGKSETDTVIVTFGQTSSHGTGFAYSLGAGAKYNLNKKLFLMVNLDFIGSNEILFKDITNTTTIVKYPGNPGGSSISQSVITGNGKQRVQSINFFAGLGLHL